MMGNYHVRFLGGKGWQQPDLPGNYGSLQKKDRAPAGRIKLHDSPLFNTPSGSRCVFMLPHGLCHPAQHHGLLLMFLRNKNALPMGQDIAGILKRNVIGFWADSLHPTSDPIFPGMGMRGLLGSIRAGKWLPVPLSGAAVNDRLCLDRRIGLIIWNDDL